MALRTFTASRPPAVGDGKSLYAWHLSAGAVALVVNFCDGTNATPLFQVQVPINSSSSATYASKPVQFPNGYHVEVVSGVLNRGCIDL